MITYDQVLQRVRDPKSDAKGVMFFCPVHPDGTKQGRRSARLWRRADGSAGVKCFAGCFTKDIFQALGFNLSDNGDHRHQEPEVTYDYKDVTGKLQYQVVRFPGKKFLQRRPDGKGGWIWDLKDVKPILYRLPKILEAIQQDQAIFIPEGERDVENLVRLDLTATTNSGGAGKWQDGFSDHLAGAVVVILPDNDDPGRKHADQVAKSLLGKAKSIKVVELPGLPDKGDVSVWLAKGGTKEGLLRLVAEAPEWEPEQDQAELMAAKTPGQVSDDHKLSQAEILLEIANDATMFHDDTGDPFARIEINGHKEIWPVRSKTFKRWLVGKFYATTGKAPNSDAVNQALGVIEARAIFDGDQHPLALRVAEYEGAFWYDLGDPAWRAIKITPDGWEIVDNPPLLFRRFKNTGAQVEPMRSDIENPLWLICDFLNLEQEDQHLFGTYQATCLIPGIPHPIPVLHGEKGSGKSILQRIIRKLVDPAIQELSCLANDKNELALYLAHNYCPAFDNLDDLKDWQSDMLCCTSTGGGISKRELYSDDDEIILKFKHCVSVNGINCEAKRADLLDRSLIFNLRRIEPGDRRPEVVFWREFEKQRPFIMGGMFDAVAGAMQLHPGISLDGLPRMADFCTWGYCIAETAGVGGDHFIELYQKNIGTANEEALTGSPVATAIRAFMLDKMEWEGRAAELLKELEPIAEQEKINIKAKKWPKSAATLGKRLREVASNLRDVGIVLTEERTEDKRTLLLQKLE